MRADILRPVEHEEAEKKYLGREENWKSRDLLVGAMMQFPARAFGEPRLRSRWRRQAMDSSRQRVMSNYNGFGSAYTYRLTSMIAKPAYKGISLISTLWSVTGPILDLGRHHIAAESTRSKMSAYRRRLLPEIRFRMMQPHSQHSQFPKIPSASGCVFSRTHGSIHAREHLHPAS